MKKNKIILSTIASLCLYGSLNAAILTWTQDGVVNETLTENSTLEITGTNTYTNLDNTRPVQINGSTYTMAIVNNGIFNVTNGYYTTISLGASSTGTSSIINNGTVNLNNSDNIAMGIQANLYNTDFITNTGTVIVNGNDSTLPSPKVNISAAIQLAPEEAGVTATNSGTLTAKYANEFDYKAYSVRLVKTNALNFTNTSTGVMNGNIDFDNDGTFTNAGKISLPYNATSTNKAVIKNFVNQGTGIVEIGLLTDGSTTTHSQLSTIDATFNDGSTINVNVLAASTNVSSIGGTTLNDVVSASNSLTINGTLNITDNSALLNFTYTKDGNTIDLKETVDKTIYDSAVLSGAEANTKKSAKKLQEIKDAGTYTQMSTIFTALNALATDKEVAQKVEETTPQTATSSVSASNHVTQAISNIVTQRQNINLGGAINGANSGDEMFVEKNIWFKPFGSIGSQKDKDGINGFDINSYGLALGIDGEYKPDNKFGMAFFYTNANVDVNNVIQSTDLDVFSLVAYGSNPIIDDKTKFMYQIGYSLQKNSSTRYVSLTSATASAKYDSKTVTIDLKLLRDYKINDDLLFQPMVSATYRYFSSPSYSETGAGALNLDVQSFSSTQLLTGIGTMAHYKIDDNSKIIANANIDYDFHHKTQTITSSYQGAAGVTFDTDGIDNGRWSYDVGVGYENQIDELSNINFSYNYQGKGKDYSNNVISLKYTYKF